MNTISDLRKILGLSTTNQVRNRIDAIKETLAIHQRRGPNNQILLTDDGVALLRRLQDLCDSGLTMTEASEVIKSNAFKKGAINDREPSGFALNRINPERESSLVAALKEEIAFLRERVAFLEERQFEERQFAERLFPERLFPGRGKVDRPQEWWTSLREEI